MYGPLNVECQMRRLVKCKTLLSDCIQIWIVFNIPQFHVLQKSIKWELCWYVQTAG